MVLFEEHGLSLTVSLVQPVELTFWDDMNIRIFFDKVTVYFSLKDIDYSSKTANSYSLSPLTLVLLVDSSTG